ncbi:MAG: hypothetical protein AAFY53_06195, partial [Pseudomonadota bacterium]
RIADDDQANHQQENAFQAPQRPLLISTLTWRGMAGRGRIVCVAKTLGTSLGAARPRHEGLARQTKRLKTPRQTELCG